jgi:hypothetical protein
LKTSAFEETCKPVWLRYGCFMATITLKDIPEDLHAQLKNEASANLRSLNQEALWRLQQSFELDAAVQSRRDQKLIDKAIGSGPETPLTRADMDKVRDRVLTRTKAA